MIDNSTAQDAIYLISCALNNKYPEINKIKKINKENLFEFAQYHMVSSTIAMALESAGVKDKLTSKYIASAQKKSIIFQCALSDVKKEMNEAGIWFMPLKGAVLKTIYPKYGMREFADHDILFDASRAEDVKRLMERIGFTTEHFGVGNHDVYYKYPCINFEMHTALFGNAHDKKMVDYYSDIEKKLVNGAGFERHFTNEDFYIYFIAHEYKHYSGSGTGIRSLMDTYVYLNAEKLDMNYIAKETDKLGIRDFEELNRSLSMHLFSGEELSQKEQRMLEYILSSGTYGTITHSVENKLKKNKWSKLHYMLNRFFVPVSKRNPSYSAYAGFYPTFYKYKILLPILPFYRTFRSIKSGRFATEANAIKKAEKSK